MIKYDLVCDSGHAFDGWFSDSSAYDRQRKRGMVECAHCGSSKIEKQVMAPNLGTRANRKPEASQRLMAGPGDPRLQQMMQMVRDVRAHVEANAENVGNKFAEEARKIHYNESEKRGIYGEATPDDAKSLIEEGIDVMPLPRLPEDGN